MARLRPLLALLALAACDATTVVSDCIPGVDPTCEAPPPVPDDVVAGVDLGDLFAAPTVEEVGAALARPAPTTSGDVTVTRLADGADGARRFLVQLGGLSGPVASALVRVPGDPSAVTLLPVVVVLPDGTDGASEADLLLDPGYGALPDRAVQVVLAYRGETLTATDRTVASDFPADPYRGDVADLRAVLDGLGRVPRADVARVALVGLGRGGTVALLGAPGTDVAAVVTLGAPTDLFGASFVAEVRARLLGSVPPAPYPALDALAAPALALRDGEATLAEAREELAALSPARLRPGTRLPPVLALHAEADAVVGREQLQSLAGSLRPGSVAALVENESHASLPRAPAVQNQIASFLLDRL